MIEKLYNKKVKPTLLVEEIFEACDPTYEQNGETWCDLTVEVRGNDVLITMEPAWEADIDQVVADHNRNKKDKNEENKEKKDKDKKDAEDKLKALGLTQDEIDILTGG